MKPPILCILLVLLSGCLSTSPEVTIPTISSDLKASLANDKLSLCYRMYEGMRGELDLKAAGALDAPTKANTALFERFASGNPVSKLPGVAVPLEIEYVSIVQDGQRTIAIDTSGRELRPSHDHIALLNRPKAIGYFGYALLRKDCPPVVFFVKPHVFASKTKIAISMPVGWKD